MASLVSSWILPLNKKVFLFDEGGNKLSFAVDSEDAKRKSFKVAAYSFADSLKFINLFHDTIGKNLEKSNQIKSSCFLPAFCTTAVNNSSLEVALFAFFDTTANPQGTLKFAHWGIRDASGVCQTIDCDPQDQYLMKFICENPGANAEQFRVNQSKFGANILPFGSSLKVSFGRICTLDNTFLFNKEIWTIALVSGARSTLFPLQMVRGEGKIGHAMLVCEGIDENGNEFFYYIHATNKARILEGKKVPSEKGVIEVIDRTGREPLTTINGPVWNRPASLGKKMLNYVNKLKDEFYVDFAFYGDYFYQSRYLKMNWQFFTNIFVGGDNHYIPNLPDFIRSDEPRTCLQWASQIAEFCGIIFAPNATSLRYPLEKIEQLKRSPICFLPNEFDHNLLGRPFPPEHRYLAEEMLSAVVIITPPDCPEEDCAKWGIQYAIEQTFLTDLEIERLERSAEQMRRDGLFSPAGRDFFGSFHYKPKFW